MVLDEMLLQGYVLSVGLIGTQAAHKLRSFSAFVFNVSAEGVGVFVSFITIRTVIVVGI